jgi:hypothetical protein
MRYVGTRNPRAEHNPLRSIPLFRPAAQVLGHTPLQRLMIQAAAARASIELSTDHYLSACQSLGRANKLKGYKRCRYTGEAFRWINRARANLRKARKELQAAEAAMLALDADLFQGAA